MSNNHRVEVSGYFTSDAFTTENDAEPIADLLKRFVGYGSLPAGDRRVVIGYQSGEEIEHSFDDLSYVTPAAGMTSVHVYNELAGSVESHSGSHDHDDGYGKAPESNHEHGEQGTTMGSTQQAVVSATLHGVGIAAASKANGIISKGVITAMRKAGAPESILENEWLVRVLLVLAPLAVHYGADKLGHLIPEAIGAHNVQKGAEFAMEGNGAAVAAEVLELFGPMLMELASVGRNADVLTIAQDQESAPATGTGTI